MGAKLFKLALARTSVPSTDQCVLTQPFDFASITVSSKSFSKMPAPSKRCSRFFENVDGSQTGESISKPTNQRNAMSQVS
jgi:hypothetical protein